MSEIVKMMTVVAGTYGMRSNSFQTEYNMTQLSQ